jgi:hypothetical protein
VNKRQTRRQVLIVHRNGMRGTKSELERNKQSGSKGENAEEPETEPQKEFRNVICRVEQNRHHRLEFAVKQAGSTSCMEQT